MFPEPRVQLLHLSPHSLLLATVTSLGSSVRALGRGDAARAGSHLPRALVTARDTAARDTAARAKAARAGILGPCSGFEDSEGTARGGRGHGARGRANTWGGEPWALRGFPDRAPSPRGGLSAQKKVLEAASTDRSMGPPPPSGRRLSLD